MILFERVVRLAVILMCLTALVFLGSGCSTTKEAVAAPEKTTAVPTAAVSPADMQKIDSAVKKVESAASISEAAAKKAELAAQKADLAADKAEKSAEKAESAAEKAEAIFMKKMKK